jgi:23S rRNA (uracil1939-C5)-methyltransferase
VIAEPFKGNHKPKDHLELIEIIDQSKDRVDPICEYYKTCGGCAIQHLKEEKYKEWKLSSLTRSLQHRGFNPEKLNIHNLIIIPPHTRRRVSLSYENFKGNVKLGFFQKLSKRIVDVNHCPLLNEKLNEILPPLKKLLIKITKPRDHGHILLTDTTNGIDMYFAPHKKMNWQSMTAEFANFAKENNVIKITRAGKEIIYLEKEPIVNFEGIDLEFPSGGFLQPSLEGENALRKIMEEEIKSKGYQNFADLFCGMGTFSFTLAKYGETKAFELDKPSIDKLNRKVNVRVTGEARNLFTKPLKPNELAYYDCIVLDPPRAGAKEQTEELAKSNVEKIIYISCDPGTFTRDAKILSDGGYKIKSITPIDQFIYTPHIETVGVFEK